MQPTYPFIEPHKPPNPSALVPSFQKTGLEARRDSNHDSTDNMLTDFENHLHNQNISPLIIRQYLIELLRFLRWFIQIYGEELSIERITPSVVQKYKKHLLNVDQLNASALKMQLTALSIITKWVRQEKQIQHNSSKQAKNFALNQHNHKWLNGEYLAILTHTIENDLQHAKKRYPKRWITRQRDASLVIFMLQTGLRLTETVSLQNSDVQLSSHQGNVSIRHGRTSRHRVVPLNDKACRTMQEWYTVRPQSKFIWTVANGKHDQALSGRAVQRILNRYAKAANINNLTPIVCRHTFARNLVSSGVRLEEAAALLGLSSLDAIRVYIPQSESSPC